MKKIININIVGEDVFVKWAPEKLVTPEELYRAISRNAEVKKILQETGTADFRMPTSKRRTNIGDIQLFEYHIGTLEYYTVIVRLVESTVEVLYSPSIEFNAEELGAFCNYYKDRVK